MQKETIRTLASIVVSQTVKDLGKQNADALALAEHLASELPGLDADVSQKILDVAEKLLPHTEVHVDVAFWRLEEAQEGVEPGVPGAVW